ncbi:MAG: VWA domain-containing protein [Planctomycetes bacterium]|nr:VWA domain-containing protein [Planctomycetota bacterium]
MFVAFFLSLRDAKVPCSLREYLTLIEAVKAGVADFDVEGFYHLARTTLVKDERYFDRFDQVFATHFGALADGIGVEAKELPEEWLRRISERVLSEEEKALVKSLGGWDKLMEELAKRLREQRESHQGGSKWIGTGGTSPFGAYGYNPEGIRIGQDGSRNRRAVKVWDRREFRDLDADVELGTRNMKMALRRLREFVREGAADELDLEGTISATAKAAGLLDVKLRPERRNRARVLLFVDAGGSMDDHIQEVTRLFSAARAEFSGLEHFYFHNCIYERVWKANADRHAVAVPTEQVLRTFGRNWKLIVIGDASMSPYELMVPGGSVEHMNPEAGVTWLTRFAEHYPKAAWLNPVPEARWDWTETIGAIRDVFGGRMYGLTLSGLERAMNDLAGRRKSGAAPR